MMPPPPSERDPPKRPPRRPRMAWSPDWAADRPPRSRSRPWRRASRKAYASLGSRPPGRRRPCAPWGIRRAQDSRGLACRTAHPSARHPATHAAPGFGCVPQTAVTTCRSRRICPSRPSWSRGLIRFGWPASPPCQPPKGGSTWPSHGISSPAKSQVRAMRDHRRAERAIAALSMAIQRQRPAPSPIHHSGRGSQYAAAGDRKVPGAAGMIQSVSRKGNCLRQCTDGKPPRHSENRVRAPGLRQNPGCRLHDVFAAIEGSSNRRRLRSALGHITPAQAERQAA